MTSAGPATKRVALFNDTRSDSHFGCSLVIQQTVALLRSRQIEVEWFWPVGRDWHGNVDWDRAERSLDGIIVNGEGTIHHSSERPRARWLTELGPFVAHNTTLPVYMINATIDSIDSASAANLSHFDGVYVRDSQSRTLIGEFGVGSEVVPDMTLSADLAVPQARRVRTGVCATDSVLPEVSGVLRETCRKRGWTYRPMRFAGKKQRPKIGRYLADGPWFLLNKFRTEELPQRFAAFTSRHRLVVTGRYHMVSFCLLTRTPFVAVESNTPKISALMLDVFGDCGRLISQNDIGNLDVERFAQWSQRESEAIDRFLVGSRAGAAAMVAGIRDTIDRRPRRSPALRAAG